MDKDIILFDGVCNFCNATINFVIEHDPNRRFRFASLQSEFGQNILHQYHYSTHDFDTVLLIKNGEMYQKAKAVLEIARYLKGYSWLYVFRFVPTPIANFFYGIIAKNRYILFGRRDTCRVPSPEERALFLG